jgi:hypothetical protein
LPNLKEVKWRCRCECGDTIVARGSDLTRKKKTSCGCARADFLNKKSEGEAAENSVIRLYKKSAALRGHEYALSDEQCRDLLRRNCHYCGSGGSNMKQADTFNGRYHYNGIDRVDNTKGYLFDNVVPCCIDCNRAKRTMGYQEFLDWVARVYRHIVCQRRAVNTDQSAPLTLF